MNEATKQVLSEQDLPEMNEDEDLRFTHATRKLLIKQIMKDGPPTETKEQMVLLSALNDMDRTTIGLKKIKSDEGMGNKQQAAAAMLAAILTDPRLKQLDQIPATSDAPRQIPTFDAECVDVIVNPGELEENNKGEDFASFNARMGIN